MELTKLEKYGLYDIEKLVEASWNWKEDDDFVANQLVNNLKRNGQVENILIRELETGFFEVVNGNHRYKAMQKIGCKKIIAYNLGKISDSHAKRIAYETNETRFKSDPVKQSDIISDLIDTFGKKDILETLPNRESEIDSLIDINSVDFEPGSESEQGQLDKKDAEFIECPHCGEKFEK